MELIVEEPHCFSGVWVSGFHGSLGVCDSANTGYKEVQGGKETPEVNFKLTSCFSASLSPIQTLVSLPHELCCRG